jgi:hypothetical protein
MASVVVGTERGITVIDPSDSAGLAFLEKTAPSSGIESLVRSGEEWWAISGRAILRCPAGGEWEEVAALSEFEPRCLLPLADGLVVGTSEAHLFLQRDAALEQIPAFDQVPGRDEWYTPWGGPPDVRSLSADAGGRDIYANVHVGGVVRSGTGGDSWEPTMDIDMDVHQVLAHPTRSGVAFAASARGLGLSEDGAASWTFQTNGLHAPYCRAVAVCEDSILVSASTGPRGQKAAIYRRTLDLETGALAGGPSPFERCADGLPEWFGGNIDTFCLAARAETAACGTAEGTVYVSLDQGRTWSIATEGLSPVACVVVA